MALSRPTSARDSYQRYSVLEYLLIGDLRDLLEETPDSETHRWLLTVLDELLDLLPNEYEFEDEGGYLADVCDQFPNWSQQVERLHHERDGLYSKLLELRNRIANEESFEYIAAEVRPELRRWIESAQRLRSTERHLVITAIDLTYGGEG